MTTNLTDDEIIEEIITSFETFALGDIRENVNLKPIAAFILCSCLIDQLAAFVYNPPPHPNSRNKHFYNLFIEKYLPQYIPLDLYVNLRCNLVHNYTIGKYLSITSDNIARQDNTTIIHASKIFNDLEKVFERIKKELRDAHSIERKNAIDRYIISKIITKKELVITTYTQNDCKKLMEYYAKALRPHLPLFGNIEKMEIAQMSSPTPDYYFIMVILSKKEGEGKFLLDDIIKITNLETAATVLERLNDSLDKRQQ